MPLPSFLKQDKNELIFDGDGTMIFYVPNEYFDKGYADVIGENISILGIFDFAIYDANGKVTTSLTQFTFPTIFLTQPSDTEVKREVRLTKDTPIKDYTLLKFVKGDKVVISTKVPQIIANVEVFFKMCLYADLPNTVRYDEVQNYFIEAMALNGSKWGFNNQLFGIWASETFRSADDSSIPFRLSGSTSMNAWKMAPIKQIPKLISKFTSFTSENFDESIRYATTMKSSRQVPLEKLMMM